jgi:peptide/nickel transport system permease protein
MIHASPKKRTFLRGVQANPMLLIGFGLMLAILLFAYAGPLFVDPDTADIGAFQARLTPSRERLLGTDTQGRDLMTQLVLATGQTLQIGLIAGVVGLAIGTFLGLVAGYFSGRLDTIITTSADVVMTIPGIAIMVLIAANTRTMTVGIMALIVASRAWMFPTRSIRAQTLSVRERSYIEVAKLNGITGVELVVREILPNLLPFLAASFAMAVSFAMLASVGLEALGLGPQNTHTLGMMIYWSKSYSAVLRGFWWWWAPPIVLIVLIFTSLLFISTGLDQIVNVRLRKEA